MNKKIALINAYHMFPQAFDWWEISVKQGINFVIITPNAYEHKILKEKGVNSILLDNYFDNVTKRELANDTNELLTKVKNNDFEDFIETEYQYYKRNKKIIKRLAGKYYHAYKRIFKELNIEKIVQLQGGEIVRRTANVAALTMGIKTIFLGESFIPGKITLYENEYKQLLIPKYSKKLPSEEYFDELLSHKINQKKVIKYTTEASIKLPKNYLVKFLVIAQQKEKHILKTYISHKLKRKFFHNINSFIAKYVIGYSSYIPQKPYFFYPLNVSAESELYIRNPEFSNQVRTLETIGRSLPLGTTLYTKPHPGSEGHLNIQDYIKIKKIPNVKLLPASTNTYLLISKAIATIISSSTVGLESNMLQKQTVVLGNWPYTNLGQFQKTTSENLAKTLDSIYKENQGKRHINPTITLKKIWEVSFSGSLWGNKKHLEEIMEEISLL